MATLSLPVDAGESPEILNGEKTKGSRLDHNTKTGHVKPNHEKFKEKKKEAESKTKELWQRSQYQRVLKIQTYLDGLVQATTNTLSQYQTTQRKYINPKESKDVTVNLCSQVIHTFAQPKSQQQFSSLLPDDLGRWQSEAGKYTTVQTDSTHQLPLFSRPYLAGFRTQADLTQLTIYQNGVF